MGSAVGRVASPVAAAAKAAVGGGGPVISYGAILGSQQQFAANAGFNFPPVHPMPRSVDLRTGSCSPYMGVWNQGSIGSCTAMTSSALMSCSQRRQKVASGLEPTPSALFNYYFERALDGRVDMDVGSSVPRALQVAQGGVANTTLWPYNGSPQGTWKDKPSSAAQKDSLFRNVSQYAQITNTVNNMKACVANGYPFGFAFGITNQMDTWFKDPKAQLQSQYLLPAPSLNDTRVAGHAVTCVGYDDSIGAGAFLIRNSWGPTWGKDQGHFYVGYDTMTNGTWFRDFHYVKESTSVTAGGSGHAVTRCPSYLSSGVCPASLSTR